MISSPRGLLLYPLGPISISEPSWTIINACKTFCAQFVRNILMEIIQKYYILFFTYKYASYFIFLYIGTKKTSHKLLYLYYQSHQKVAVLRFPLNYLTLNISELYIFVNYLKFFFYTLHDSFVWFTFVNYSISCKLIKIFVNYSISILGFLHSNYCSSEILKIAVQVGGIIYIDYIGEREKRVAVLTNYEFNLDQERG